MYTGVAGLPFGKGTFVKCHFEANVHFGALLDESSALNFEHCHFLHGKSSGIQCRSGSAGVIDSCTFDGPKVDSIVIEPGSRTRVIE